MILQITEKRISVLYKCEIFELFKFNDNDKGSYSAIDAYVTKKENQIKIHILTEFKKMI